MNPFSLRLAVVGVLVLLVASSMWKIQDWRYGKQLAEQDRLHQSDLAEMSRAAADQALTEQGKRVALEDRLSVSEQTHYEVMTNVQKDQARLRDRLATADVRLSVLLDANDAPAGCALPAATGTSSVDHGALRARLDPAHAQRIIAITDEGDRGLIALQACQAYVKALGQ
ncbi:bacteriophage Rz lysis protein [Pseudomonas sp. SJZ101]|nr:bacteriophage Rz lysis protein [Pseudomonas sp. SJZ075]TWC31486.1 bacteriophage Rz lysis protein [Pseudomonas sp. SJZ078]TWC52222.1 bacteriophage Rz lysis protein [Pseudomonas sp. SJZ124]TWC87152.1 bacteriophage Rz lysis protein [Pseudomonas sp. SJZ101]